MGNEAILTVRAKHGFSTGIRVLIKATNTDDERSP